jgi:hypothetical protein
LLLEELFMLDASYNEAQLNEAQNIGPRIEREYSWAAGSELLLNCSAVSCSEGATRCK